MTAIMSIDEPRPRGTVFGERADRRGVNEAEHFFRCEICGGFIDGRDLAWVEDQGRPVYSAASSCGRIVGTDGIRSAAYFKIIYLQDGHSNARTSPNIRMRGLGARSMRVSHCGQFSRSGSMPHLKGKFQISQRANQFYVPIISSSAALLMYK
jgi:hypothetical protein